MKRLLTILSLLTLSFTAFSLPGFTPFIQDIPGSYVWYQDFTFQRESYVGFLTFDSSTYQARYFAPQNAKAKLPEKDIKIYFSLDPEADHIEMTGEKVIAGVSQEDTELVNYLHDMVYELNARRIKAGEIAPGSKNTASGESSGGITGSTENSLSLNKNGSDTGFLHSGINIREDFAQFGGDVTVIYDFLVPLFNVKLIESAAGKTELNLVTCGRIQSTEDNSFDAFKGFPQKFPSKKHGFKKSKKAEKMDFNTPDGQKITLDSDWTRSMENLWLLGDAALISAGLIPENNAGNETAEASLMSITFILRQLLLSSGTSYTDWNSLEIQNYSQLLGSANPSASANFKVSANIWQNDTQNLTKSLKILSKKNGGYALFTFTAFENVYQKNRAYFDTIVKSYQVN